MRLLTEYSINYDANNIEECREYIGYRNLQLLKFGIILVSSEEHEWGISCKYNAGEAFFILKSFRGKGIYRSLTKDFHLSDSNKIITLEECNISEYLLAKKIPHWTFRHSEAYKLIRRKYMDGRAKRSGIPLIYHIDEGGAILNSLSSFPTTKDAYYIHPLLQSDVDFLKNKSEIPGELIDAAILAMEYRRVANSYLSTMDMRYFTGLTCPEIREMLIADKVQNYKDFLTHHKSSHSKSEELDKYFNNWFDILEIRYEDFSKIIL